MASEESSERSELRAVQRERERERRRLRDRQRRQTMTIEQRENHLARRRRNYQLRRQKVGSDSQPQLASIASRVPLSDLSEQCDTTTAKQRNAQMIVGNEATTCKLDELPKSLRLNHIRHIARSLNNPGGNDRTALALTKKEKESTLYQSPKGLRLSNVKRLARGLNSITRQITDHIPEEGVAEEEQIVGTQSDIQLLCNDTVNSAQPVNTNGNDEQMYG